MASIHYRATVAEIDLGALRYNASEVMKRLPAGTQVMAIVKASAYGHGALFCARTLKGLGVSQWGVATVEEGIELREGGIPGEIFILDGLVAEALQEFLNFRLKPILHHLEEVGRFGAFLKSVGHPHSCHLKFDTGMGRLGLSPSDIDALIPLLKQYPELVVEGILTHLARADEKNPEPTDRQFLLFERLRKILAEKGQKIPCSHIANSAAIIDGRFDSHQLVRPGIMLYGAYPNPRHQTKISLKPVMCLKTKILSIKKIPPGTAVSYGGTWVSKRETLVATLPVGYADGYPRLLSNKGEVLLKERRVPVIGRVCMDLTLVDATDVPGAAIGDEVVLIGQQGESAITAEEVADWAETISYEIFCGISSRVPRVYKGL